MDPSSTPDYRQIGHAKVLPDPVLSHVALELAKAYPFAMGEDGQIDVIDIERLERTLYEEPGQLSMTASDWVSRLSAEDARTRRAALASLTWEGAHYSVDYVLNDGQGQTRHFREAGRAVAVADGVATLIHGVLIDRSDDARGQDMQIWDAFHDSETTLPNGRAFCRDAARLGAVGHELGQTVHILRMRHNNISDLARVYGPSLQRLIAREVKSRLEDVAPSSTILARLDERDFALAIIGEGLESLTSLIKETMTGSAIQTPFGPIKVEMSVSVIPMKKGDRIKDVLDTLRARLEGNLTYKPALQTARPDIQDLLASDAISLAFQPIVRTATSETAHHECLLRVKNADGSLTTAAPLILQAERNGLISQLDLKALALARPYLESNSGLRLALNVSAGTVRDREAATIYLEALENMGGLTQRIIIEMTETLAVDDPAQSAEFSARARAFGCRFAIDDFGAGHTTFRNLLAVEADSVKIDGSLISGIATDISKQSFMRMMVDLAQTFNVSTVAEMVETKADADALAHIGVDYCQGYYFGRPTPAPV